MNSFLECVPAKRAATTPAKKPAPHTIEHWVNTFSIQVKINETFLNLRRYALEWNHERWRLEFSTLIDKIRRTIIIASLSCMACWLAHYKNCFPSFQCYMLKTHGMNWLYAWMYGLYFIPYFRCFSPAKKKINIVCVSLSLFLLLFFVLFHSDIDADSVPYTLGLLYTYKSGKSIFIIHVHTTITSGTKPNYITLIVVVFFCKIKASFGRARSIYFVRDFSRSFDSLYGVIFQYWWHLMICSLIYFL